MSCEHELCCQLTVSVTSSPSPPPPPVPPPVTPSSSVDLSLSSPCLGLSTSPPLLPRRQNSGLVGNSGGTHGLSVLDRALDDLGLLAVVTESRRQYLSELCCHQERHRAHRSTPRRRLNCLGDRRRRQRHLSSTCATKTSSDDCTDGGSAQLIDRLSRIQLCGSLPSPTAAAAANNILTYGDSMRPNASTSVDIPSTSRRRCSEAATDTSDGWYGGGTVRSPCCCRHGKDDDAGGGGKLTHPAVRRRRRRTLERQSAPYRLPCGRRGHRAAVNCSRQLEPPPPRQSFSRTRSCESLSACVLEDTTTESGRIEASDERECCV